MDTNSRPCFSHIAAEANQEASELLNLADSMLKDCIAEGNIADLDSAIYLFSQAARTWPDRTPKLFECLNLLSTALLTRFSYTGQAKDVNAVFALHVWMQMQISPLNLGVPLTDALKLLPDSGLENEDSEVEDDPAEMMNLAASTLTAFHQAINFSNLNNIAYLFQQAISEHELVGPEQSKTLMKLANAHLLQFQVSSDRKKLQESVSLLRELHMIQPNYVHWLCVALLTAPQGGAHVQEVAELLRQALASDEEALELVQTGTNFLQVSQQSADPLDMTMAVLTLEKAKTQLSWGHSAQIPLMKTLGYAFSQRFQIMGEPTDLDRAIEIYRGVLDLQTLSDPQRGPFLEELVVALVQRFDKTGEPADIDGATGLIHEGLNLFPHPHPNHYIWLDKLALSLSSRFHTWGDRADLDTVLGLHREALERRGAHDPDRHISLNNLSTTLIFQFEITGDPADLDSAIALSREALGLLPGPDPNRACILANLASQLGRRFGMRGEPADLDSAIDLYQESLDLGPPEHQRFMAMGNLGITLSLRSTRWGEPADLDRAIGLMQQVLDLLPTPSINRGMALSNLAEMLHRRFQSTGDLADQNRNTVLSREALHLFPDSHPKHGIALFMLGNSLRDQFTATREATDIDSAIGLYREALDLHPPPEPQHAHILDNLAGAFRLKYEHTGLSHDIDEAVAAYRVVSAYTTLPLFDRWRASGKWTQTADMHNHASALEAYETAIALLPELAMLGLDIQSRHKALSTGTNVRLPSSAASCASHLNEMGKAVEFLEAGRSVFWSQALQLHTSIDDLHSIHPELALKISQISQKLKVGSHRDVAAIRVLPGTHRGHIVLDNEDKHYRELNAAWVQSLHDIRVLPGFEGFLRPKLLKELQVAAINGPVVILNVGERSSTALIVTVSKEVQCVELGKIGWHGAQVMVQLFRAVLSGSEYELAQFISTSREVSTEVSELRDRLLGKRKNSGHYSLNIDFGDLLKVLWTELVQPIFQAMKLKKSVRPSRLWWCPTGPLTLLPIHAAGIYGDAGADCVSDYVVSSYTPTLTSMLNPPTKTTTPFKMTAVIQPDTPNCSSLPATWEELERIQKNVPTQWLTSLGHDFKSPATVESALHHLQESSIAHFACHGMQNVQNPLNSALLLTDGPLKVSELMRRDDHLKSRQKNMTLAFLGACETAKGDDKVPDEAMHLAATLLFAGFRGVIATMWSVMIILYTLLNTKVCAKRTIADRDAPKIADAFYEHLFKGCDATSDPPVLPDLTKAAEALHIAIAKLREDPDVSFNRWVPFVHYGL
ncbi:CHAT domain-containing protein [Mycena leptocephala]|nr:CHAT domain-containing protein [Mycena leptocephala]